MVKPNTVLVFDPVTDGLVVGTQASVRFPIETSTGVYMWGPEKPIYGRVAVLLLYESPSAVRFGSDTYIIDREDYEEAAKWHSGSLTVPPGRDG